MIDPWEAFAAEAREAECAGYLERGDAPGVPGRWTVSFTDPAETFQLRPDDSPEALDERTARLLRGRPHRGLLGYTGFDAAGLFEPLLRRFPAGSPFPLGEWAVVDDLRPRPAPPLPVRPVAGLRKLPAPRPRSDSLPRRAFERSVDRLRRAIGDGEAFQVVLSHRRSWPRPLSMLPRAGDLRARERFAYFYYLKFGDREILGASPESVLEVQGTRAFVSPIAGTRPRGAGGAGRHALARDPKELAEHRMLVDLARNDLGRVARPGTVRLLWQERNERFARLDHLVTRVEARLEKEVGPWQALAATFPAGTVSGAPKIRATHLLRREEDTWRGPYAGAVGYLHGRNADWALAIRSAFAAGRRLYTAAGAGVVWRSRPAREFHETLTKLAELESAVAGKAGR